MPGIWRGFFDGMWHRVLREARIVTCLFGQDVYLMVPNPNDFTPPGSGHGPIVEMQRNRTVPKRSSIQASAGHRSSLRDESRVPGSVRA